MYRYYYSFYLTKMSDSEYLSETVSTFPHCFPSNHWPDVCNFCPCVGMNLSNWSRTVAFDRSASQLTPQRYPPLYEPHLSQREIDEGISSGLLLKGKLRINQKNAEDCYVTCSEEVLHDISVPTLKARWVLLLKAFRLEQFPEFCHISRIICRCL